jgi:hypothetical protein
MMPAEMVSSSARLVELLTAEADAAKIVLTPVEIDLLSRAWITLSETERKRYRREVEPRAALFLQLIGAAIAKRRETPDFLDELLREVEVADNDVRESPLFDLARRAADGSLNPPSTGWTLAAIPVAFAGVVIGSLWSWWMGVIVVVFSVGVYGAGVWRTKLSLSELALSDDMVRAVRHRQTLESG